MSVPGRRDAGFDADRGRAAFLPCPSFATAVTPPFLILQTGRPVDSMRRHGGFPHWIRVAAGLHRDEAVVIDVQEGEPLPRPHGFAGVIVTGSAAMVTERAPWSERAAEWLRERAHEGLPLFGICYGHQLIAHALGGEVRDNPAGREMGTVHVELHPHAADDPLFAGLPARFPAQATHLQTVARPPEGAVVLARSARDGCQAYRWRDSAWGVQFHPEFSARHMRGYVRARREALHREGLDPHATERGVSAAPHARRVLRRFVRHARSRR
ncbi:GMP synthase [Vulcaniibacterium thermophilum]|uniref:GMP synthase n=1 Tax=Vulcaniibacterium thermophilum TaxID=1169913 RepID=A0A918Z9T2_9GAMM|nr:GMP synthase [Vulcaniibacterium thermophilum]